MKIWIRRPLKSPPLWHCVCDFFTNVGLQRSVVGTKSTQQQTLTSSYTVLLREGPWLFFLVPDWKFIGQRVLSFTLVNDARGPKRFRAQKFPKSPSQKCTEPPTPGINNGVYGSREDTVHTCLWYDISEPASLVSHSHMPLPPTHASTHSHTQSLRQT